MPAALETTLAARRTRAGFTLVEVMVSATLSVFVLAAVITSFLFLGRSGANIQNYSDMEREARRALEQFAEDTRQASAVSWTSANSLTLVVNASSIAYAYDSGTAQFTRTVDGGTPSVLLRGITAFSFKAYTITTAPITDFSTAAARTTANRTTKQIQISLSAQRTSTTVATATNTVLSARFILRNKRVTV